MIFRVYVYLPEGNQTLYEIHFSLIFSHYGPNSKFFQLNGPNSTERIVIRLTESRYRGYGRCRRHDYDDILWFSEGWYWWTLMNTDEYWWTLMNIDEHWWTLMNFDEHWWTLMNIDEYWWILMNIDEYWWILMNIDEYWWILMNIDELKYHLMVDDMSSNPLPSKIEKIIEDHPPRCRGWLGICWGELGHIKRFGDVPSGELT